MGVFSGRMGNEFVLGVKTVRSRSAHQIVPDNSEQEDWPVACLSKLADVMCSLAQTRCLA